MTVFEADQGIAWLAISSHSGLSAREHEREKVEALDAGAGDYLGKPLGVPELLARVRAQLRRSNSISNGSAPSSTVCFGSITVDLATHEILRNGKAVHLTTIEFRLLSTPICGHG